MLLRRLSWLRNFATIRHNKPFSHANKFSLALVTISTAVPVAWLYWKRNKRQANDFSPGDEIDFEDRIEMDLNSELTKIST